MSTATLRDSLDTVFTDGDWFLDVAMCLGDESTPENITTYDHFLTLRRRAADRLADAPEPIKLSTEDGSLLVTAPNLVGPRVRAPQLQAWEEGVYDFAQSWLRPDGVTEVVLVGALRVQKGLSLGGSFGALPIPSTGPSLTVIRSPGQARVVRGTRGAAGWNGWTMVPAIDDATAPPRRLVRVVDWAGGGGEKPTVGAWLGVGGLVTDPADATDFGGVALADVITATTAAIDAANLANAKADLADQKATLADQKATAAQAAKEAADTAAGNANAKATLADQKATLADQKATAANDAAAAANTAADNANTKATLADQKATLADQKATAANDAAAAANTAAGNANAKAALADAAAINTNIVVAAATSALVGATGQAIVSLIAPRVLTAADHGKLLAFTGAAPALLYVPPGLPDGFRIEVMKAGTADVFVTGVGGVTVGGVAGKTGLSTQYASELVRWVGANNYAVTNGEASAAPPSLNFPDFSKARASGQALFWFA